MDLEVPRDRNSEFEPEIVPKNSSDLSSIEDKVISMYAKGMSTRDISGHIEDLYNIPLSAQSISRLTDKILPVVQDWQNRPLDSKYSLSLWMLSIKVKQNNRIVSKAAYIVIGIDTEGIKDVLGIWIGENESSKFWLKVLTDLSNIRTSTRYVSYKDIKALMADLKSVYQAANEKEGYKQLGLFKKNWNNSYPTCVKSWYDNWEELSSFFKYSTDLRKIMYTTNIIENLNRQYRKVTQAKTIFPTDEAFLKMIYLATEQAVTKWTQRVRGWDKIRNELSIHENE